MTAFLITFKPAAENPKYGWPLPDLQKLVHRLSDGEPADEPWRFRNKDAKRGDRVFLLLQGKGGPAIIGYGTVNGKAGRRSGTARTVPIKFERLVDPSVQVLASKEELLNIPKGKRFWRTQFSGVRLEDNVAAELEALISGRAAKAAAQVSASNPDWTRDELIVALDVYLRHRPNPPNKGSKEISDLSRVLNQLGARLFRADVRSTTFRNENGVYMKLMNFRRLDPQYTTGGHCGTSVECPLCATSRHPPPHSITSSARAMKVARNSKPRVFAVSKLGSEDDAASLSSSPFRLQRETPQSNHGNSRQESVIVRPCDRPPRATNLAKFAPSVR